VWYAVLRTGDDASSDAATCPDNDNSQPVSVDFIPVHYDHQQLVRDMRAESLPEEFVETVLTGWWTTCLEILPSRERRRGKH
jgi:hypothetical protein